MGGSPQHRPIVTLAALYGAGGSVVGPRVAERLGVEFLDRGIPQAVASESGLPEKTVARVEDEPRSPLGRFAASLSRLSTVTGEGGGERLDLQESDVRGQIEKLLARTRQTGGVVLGHGGVVVLRNVPWALHVHLRGPRDARVRQATSVNRIDEDTAGQQQEREDAARRDYLRRVYGVDGNEVSLYHVVLDSTALSLDACVDIIVNAANARIDHPGPSQKPDERHQD